MFLRQRITQLLIAVFILAINFNSLNAAWWDKNNLPVPIGAEEVKKEARRISGSEFELVYYESNQPASQIKDFYRQRLPNLGWQEKELVKELTQKQGIHLDPSLVGALEQNLTFEKGDETLIISVMPGEYFQNRKTKLTLSRGKLKTQEEIEANTEPEFGLLAKPKKDVAPVYPGATLLSLAEPGNSQQATYSAKDDIDKVALFYKANMPSYGWSLTAEQSPQRVGTQGVDPGAIQRACPTCPKEGGIQSVETWASRLSFSNQKGEFCGIDLARVIPIGASSRDFETTIIRVDYGEKEK